jgi:Lipid A 3-O-deacylase (PagL)
MIDRGDPHQYCLSNLGEGKEASRIIHPQPQSRFSTYRVLTNHLVLITIITNVHIQRLKTATSVLLCLILSTLVLAQDSQDPPLPITSRKAKAADFNREIYYKNKLEFSLEGGVLPRNIPFVFTFLTSGRYNRAPLDYTLAPIIASLRWQMDSVRGPNFLRGNWDLTVSGSLTLVPRGPETRYFAYIMGVRRNFVQPRWRIAPYFEGRLGLGNIDAKEPLGVRYAQGQDFTFTVMLGSGVRYNFNPRYSISAGVGYMHISNLYLSEPKYPNYGINVYGPMVGITVQVGKPKATPVK